MQFSSSKTHQNKFHWITITVLISGIITACTGAVILVLWNLDVFDFVSPDQKYIPMADETALLFFVFGLALVSYQKGLVNRKFFYFVRFSARIISIVTLLVFVDIFSGNLLKIRNFLGRDSAVVAGLQSGSISFLTAFCFLLLSGGLLMLQQNYRRISLVCSFTTFFIGYLVVVGYAYGVPIFYGGTIIPMALLTGITFLISSTGLFFAVGKETFPVRYFVDDTVRSRLLRVLVPTIFVLVQIQSFFLSLYSGKFGSSFALTNGISSILVLLVSGVIIYLISKSIGTSIDNYLAERKQMEEELRSKTEQLVHLNAEKDKYFSIIAHDLRSPFSGFLGLTETMAKDLPQMSNEEIQETSVILHRSANNLYNLLGNLLEWSHMQRGFTNFEPIDFLLRSRVNECLSLTAEAASKKNIELEIKIPAGISVFADINMFDSIIRNITNNGVKFTPKDGKISITASLLSNNDVIISIKDTGIGMSKQIRDNLFLIDVNTARKGTEGESSTGLGLIICRDFIEKHNGKFWVESKEGKGSNFHFTLSSGQKSKVLK